MKDVISFEEIKNQKELDLAVKKTYCAGEYEALCWVKGANSLNQDDTDKIESRMVRLMDFIGEERAREITRKIPLFN